MGIHDDGAPQSRRVTVLVIDCVSPAQKHVHALHLLTPISYRDRARRIIGPAKADWILGHGSLSPPGDETWAGGVCWHLLAGGTTKVL